jgi:hypothetical protein
VKLVPPEVENASIPADKYTDLHAVCLYDVGWVHYHPKGLVEGPSLVFTRQTKIKLLTRAATEADRFGNISILHVGPLIDLEAHVHKPDGRVISLTAHDLVVRELERDVVEKAVPPIHLHETTLLFPDLAPGDSIAYKFTRYRPEWYWRFNRLDIPVLFSRFVVEKRWQKYALQVVVNDRHGLKPQKTIMTGAATAYLSPHHVWTAVDVPPIKRESFMPPLAELASHLTVWYRMPEADLDRLVRCYRDWITHSGKPGHRAEVAAKELAAEADKARAVQRWVRNHLNIHDPSELSNISPHWSTPRLNLKKLLQDRNATCEQAASLMWAMLKSFGIEADLVLTTGHQEPSIDEDMHDLTQFTHVFLALEDGTLLDTTDELLPPGTLSWKYQGRDAVYATKEGFEKRRLPASSSDENTATIDANVEIDVDGPAKAEARLTFTGQVAYSIRRRLSGMTAGQRQGWLGDLFGGTADRVEVVKAEIKHLLEPDRSLEASTVFRHRLKTKKTSGGVLVSLAPFMESMGCPGLVDKTRKNPVRFPYRKSALLKVLFTLPAGYRLAEMPKNISIPDPHQPSAARFDASFRMVQERVLEMKCVLRIDETRVPAGDYRQLRSIFGRLLELRDGWIFLEKLNKVEEQGQSRL